jgi:hypothetical protein
MPQLYMIPDRLLARRIFEPGRLSGFSTLSGNFTIVNVEYRSSRNNYNNTNILDKRHPNCFHMMQVRDAGRR